MLMTQMGMGLNSTLGVVDGVGATVGDNLMLAGGGVVNSSSIEGCVSIIMSSICKKINSLM